MYRYDQLDQAFVEQRVAEFRDQTRRFLAGALSEEEFKPLRLRNGLYIQRHAPMLRIAIPYGVLSAHQLRALGSIALRYDRGVGHFTTRQNLQLNWPKLPQVPDILAELAAVQMHAIQTSGNCVRNITTDHLAGVAPDELEDPRPYCEVIRQWATLNPEFTYLPRKFKIAVSGAREDRVWVTIHDIGLRIRRDTRGGLGFEVWLGGGLGRQPILAQRLREFLPLEALLAYLEAILRVYNRLGRRDTLHKARLKILLKALGLERMRELIEQEWRDMGTRAPRLDRLRLERMRAHFAPPPYDARPDIDPTGGREAAFRAWYRHNTRSHRKRGYRAAFVSLKAPGCNPGDMTAAQMTALAALAAELSFGEVRVTHDQNLLLADVPQSELYGLWRRLREQALATPNVGTLTDMIACPGLDFCALANAETLGLARAIQARFEGLENLYDLGPIELKMSGCMNACAHHHIGHIGILGLDKQGKQYYQITLGGSGAGPAALGEVIGPSVPQAQVPATLERIIEVYRREREVGERFIDTLRRIGIQPFKERAYAVDPAAR